LHKSDDDTGLAGTPPANCTGFFHLYDNVWSSYWLLQWLKEERHIPSELVTRIKVRSFLSASLLRCHLMLTMIISLTKTGSGQTQRKLKEEMRFTLSQEFVTRVADFAVSVQQKTSEPVPHNAVNGANGGGAENASPLTQFYTITIILPRQARDKHRKSSEKRDALLCLHAGDLQGGMPAWFDPHTLAPRPEMRFNAEVTNKHAAGPWF
jgi:hypothetical protein